MHDIEEKASHVEADPRDLPDPDRVNMPEGLRRERKSAYAPTTGRRGEGVDSEETQDARRRQGAKD